MGNILLVLVAVASLAAAGASFVVFSGRAKQAQRDLAASREEHRRAADGLSRAEAERETLRAERDELARTRDAMADERDRAWATVDEEEQRRVDAQVQVEELQTLLGEAESATDAEDSSKEAKEADGCWALLLADVERRWAAVVGAPPDGRGVHLGAVSDQLGEALTREVDRLREEVGVDIGLRADASVEPDDPVLFLLAATDLLNLLASGCQQVALTLDGTLAITGSEWAGTPEELEQARDRVLAAGALVDPLVIEANTVEQLAETGERHDEAEGGLLAPTRQTYEIRVAVHPSS